MNVTRVVSAVEAIGLEKRYASGAEAVRGVSFHVEPGEVFGLLGQNGAGKTTTVRMLVGLLTPTAGTGLVCGFDVTKDPRAVRRRIGFAAQLASVDPLLTVHENLTLTARLRGMSRADASARTAELIERLDLGAAASTRALVLSGGMRRRADLAQAIIGSPEVLFLDEPTVGLDPESRHALWDVILELRTAGTAVLLTTHYLEEADRVCDRVAIIAAGRIVADGTPAALKQDLCVDTLAVTVDGADPDAPQRAAVGLASVAATSPRVVGTTITTSLANGRTLVDAITALHSTGVALTGLDVREPTLEEVYLRHSASASAAASAATTGAS